MGGNALVKVETDTVSCAKASWVSKARNIVLGKLLDEDLLFFTRLQMLIAAPQAATT